MDVSAVTANDIRLVRLARLDQNLPLMYPTEHKSIIFDVCRLMHLFPGYL